MMNKVLSVFVEHTENKNLVQLYENDRIIM